MLEYLFIAFVVIICIQFIYYIFIFGLFAFSTKKPAKTNFNQPISIIICAKNESENLTKNLPFFSEQTYSNFELILINDCSKDSTLEVMKRFKNKSSIPVKIVNIEANKHFLGSKKNALTKGIKVAKNKYLLFTDADCKPISKNWILEMATHFTSKHQIVLGYGAYKKIKNSLLNKLIRFETILTAIQYFSYAKVGIPYMGVGRNLAYTKQLFYANNGFENHLKIKSGDDDLFINQAATKQNTAICYSKESFTISEPKTSLKSWISQKRRHISRASYYKPLPKFLLALFYSSQLLFWGIATILLLLLFKWQLVIILILIRFAILYFIIGFSAKKLNEKDIVLYAPFLEIFLIFIQMFIFIKNLISKPTHW